MCYFPFIGAFDLLVCIFSLQKTIIKIFFCLPPLNSSGFNRTCATAQPATTHKHQKKNNQSQRAGSKQVAVEHQQNKLQSAVN